MQFETESTDYGEALVVVAAAEASSRMDNTSLVAKNWMDRDQVHHLVALDSRQMDESTKAWDRAASIGHWPRDRESKQSCPGETNTKKMG